MFFFNVINGNNVVAFHTTQMFYKNHSSNKNGYLDLLSNLLLLHVAQISIAPHVMVC